MDGIFHFADRVRHMPRILIADDHRLVVAGLSELLATEAHRGHRVRQRHAAERRGRLAPEIILLDIWIPHNTLALIPRIKHIDPSVRIIIVTIENDPRNGGGGVQGWRVGVRLEGLCPVGADRCVHHVMDRQSYVTPLVAGDVFTSFMKSGESHTKAPLTDRQREVLQLLAEGKSMKEAAAILNVAARTVAFHESRMMRELKIGTSAELVRFAVAHKIV